MNKEIKTFNNNYEICHTNLSKHQGVLIDVKKGLTSKLFINSEPYILAVQINIGFQNYFIIGGYFKEKIKEKILNEIKRFINRIRISSKDSKIILFGDINTNKTFTIQKVENQLNLSASDKNKEITTRTQMRIWKMKENTLDCFLSS